MADERTFQVVYDYTDVPTLKRFTLDNSRVRCALGPFGCLSGDTLVITEEGLLPISAIDRPMRVLSWNEKTNQFQFSPCGNAFPKGKDYLYRVVTPHGGFDAAGFHRVFGAGYKYRSVENLQVGDVLHSASRVHFWKYFSFFLKSLFLDVPRYSQTVLDCLDRYAKSARQYGQQFLEETNIFPVSFPLPVDVHKSVFRNGLNDFLQRDDQKEQLPLHNHQDQPVFHKRIDGYFLQVEPRNEGVAGYTYLQFFGHIFYQFPQFLQHLWQSVYRRIKKLPTLCFHSYLSSSISECAILSIERKKVKEVFWDIQVLDTNNYVTEDGTIHHNSGKSSACVMDIIRRAHEQTPSPDGIRRTRWAVVRNSYGQLKDTTIRTVHDWFPPKLFGEYRVTDHTYIITKFPGVHLEVLFRALDRPDQVSNLLSLEVTGAWFNEVREIPQTIIEAMDARIGRYPSKRDGGPSWYGMIMDTNPPDEDSYIYNMFERIRPEGWRIFKQPSGLSVHAENTLHLPKNYYVNLAKGKDPMYIRVYIDGQYGFIISGKPVFATFVDNTHMAPHPLEPDRTLDVVVGFDFGLQPTCVIGQQTRYGQLRILDELVSDGMGLRQFCQNQLLPLLRQRYFGMRVAGFGDPSGVSRMPTDESTCFEVLNGNDVGLHHVVPAPTNALIPRIGAVETYLGRMVSGEPGLIISPNCKHLRKACNGAYHYERDRKSVNNEYKFTPAKNFSSHVADAFQMLCMYMVEKEHNDVKYAKFEEQIKRLQATPYRPASSEAGY